MPAHDGRWSNQDQRRSPVRPDPSQGHPQQPVGVRRVVLPGAGRNPQVDGPTNARPGSGAANCGESAVKGASA